MADDDLAAVLTLLHTSDSRWRTLRAEGDQWADPERSREAFLRAVPAGSVVSARGTPGPDDSDPTWKLWLAPPRFRADFGGPRRTRTLVIGDGRRTCFSHPASDFLRVTEQRERRPHVGPPTALLRPEGLPGALALTAEGRQAFLGRQVLVVRGRPRPEAEQRGLGMAMGADEVRFAVDADRGVLLWIEHWLDGAPYGRVAMTSVAFDDDLEPALFAFPDGPEVPEPALAVRGEPGPRRAAPPREGPPHEVLGQPVAGATVVARTATMVVAADRIVAYPTGFELGVTIRTTDGPVHGSFDDQRHRAWSGSAAFPGERIRVEVVFADSRRARLIPIHGYGTQNRYDQRYWVAPLPPPGPLGVVVEWEPRGLPEARADLDAGPILAAAAEAKTLW